MDVFYASITHKKQFN